MLIYCIVSRRNSAICTHVWQISFTVKVLFPDFRQNTAAPFSREFSRCCVLLSRDLWSLKWKLNLKSENWSRMFSCVTESALCFNKKPIVNNAKTHGKKPYSRITTRHFLCQILICVVWYYLKLDLNSQPSDCESPPLTTRPRLPPPNLSNLWQILICIVW